MKFAILLFLFFIEEKYNTESIINQPEVTQVIITCGNQTQYDSRAHNPKTTIMELNLKMLLEMPEQKYRRYCVFPANSPPGLNL